MAHSSLRPFPNVLLYLVVLATLTASTRAEETPPKILGECTVADLSAEPYVEWFDRGRTEYTPNAEVLEGLRTTELGGLDIEIIFGTWCGDSRREVPRMVELLDTLGFPAERLRLIAVDNTDEQLKRSPGGEEAGLEIYRVPTIRVLRNGEELGRIVEHPALSLERDLLAIVGGDGYRASYQTYPVVRRWLEEGLLGDPNISADGLASQIRALVSSEWELYSSARVLGSRGDLAEAAKLMEVNCALFWESASCHHRLAEAQVRAGQLEAGRKSAVRALERNDDPERVEALVELIDRSAADRVAVPDLDPVALEDQLRAAETAFAAAFETGDMDAFAGFLSDDAIFLSGENPLRGKEAITAAWTRLRGTGETPPFNWRPDRVAVEAGGLYGQSTGPVQTPDGRWVATFVSTWRRTPEGWKILLDLGPDCPPATSP